MKEERIAKQFMSSDLFTEFGNFFVSTCHRPSSAALAPDNWYYETFAWKLGKQGQREDWVADNSGAISDKSAMEQHFEVCRQLAMNGIFNEDIPLTN